MSLRLSSVHIKFTFTCLSKKCVFVLNSWFLQIRFQTRSIPWIWLCSLSLLGSLDLRTNFFHLPLPPSLLSFCLPLSFPSPYLPPSLPPSVSHHPSIFPFSTQPFFISPIPLFIPSSLSPICSFCRSNQLVVL